MTAITLTDAHRTRLARELILWLTTVKPDGQPQSHPVWFVVEGDDLLMWSVPGERSKNLEDNKRVSANVNDNGRGGDVLTIEGIASFEPERGPGSANPDFVSRYQPLIDSFNSTWDWFDGRYDLPIRITPTKIYSS